MPHCSLTRLILYVWFLGACALADQVVYLDRIGIRNGGDPVFEPVFNPTSLNAAVGEQVHFVARFLDLTNSPRHTVPNP